MAKTVGLDVATREDTLAAYRNPDRRAEPNMGWMMETAFQLGAKPSEMPKAKGRRETWLMKFLGIPKATRKMADGGKSTDR